MNTVYRVVWNPTASAWVVVSELARGKKKASVGKVASVAIAVVTVSAFSSPASAVLSMQQFTNGAYCESNGDDSDPVWSKTYPCLNVTGGSGNNGTRNPGQNILMYSRYSVLRGEDSIAMGGDLDVWGKSSLHGLYMNGARVTGVGQGISGTDAVNVTQLMTEIGKVSTGTTDANAVHYDTGTSSGKVTLAGGANGTTITNVKAGDITTATSTDAVNGGQLFATNQNVTNLTNNFNTLNTTVDGLLDDALLWDDVAVAYNAQRDDADQRITGVADGVNANDAINKKQFDALAKDLEPTSKYVRFGAVPAAEDASAKAQGSKSVAIGAKSFASGDGAFAMGYNARAAYDNSVAIGAGSQATGPDSFAVGNSAVRRRIVNVADGVDPTDAVTVKQLDDKFNEAVKAASFSNAKVQDSLLHSSGGLRTAQVVATAASPEAPAEAPIPSKYGSTNVTTNATAAQPSVLGASSATAVAAAAFVEQAAPGAALEVGKNLDGTAVSFRGTAGDRTLAGVAAGKVDDEAINAGQLKAAGVMNVQGDVNSVVAYDSASRSSVTLGGQGAAPVALHNVAAGSANTDAVNVAQLNQRLGETRDSAVHEANAYTDQRVNDIWTDLDEIANKLSRQDRRISDVGAMSTAHAQMVSNATTASLRGDNGAWAIGLGHQESRNAVSVGYAKSIGEKSQVSFGASFSGDDQSIGLGFGRAL